MNTDQMIDDIYDGYDIAEQKIDMSREDCDWYEMLCEVFGEDQ